jgi:hypothetical protein
MVIFHSYVSFPEGIGDYDDLTIVGSTKEINQPS